MSVDARAGSGARPWAWIARPVVVDAAWAVPLALASFVTAGYSSSLLGFLCFVQVGALVLRRLAPFTSVGVVFVVGLVRWAVFVAGLREGGTLLQLSDLAVPVALYSTAAHGPRWLRWTSLGGAALGAALFGLATLVDSTPDGSRLNALLVVGVSALASFGVCLLAWTGGQLRRVRLEQLAATAEAARRAQAEAEQRVLVAAAEERARIARELHDVVAHSLSVVIAQADGGRYAAAADPAAALTALETVASTGRAALGDMRRLLGVLREGDDAAMAPQPGADDLAALVASVRASGLDVALTRLGEPVPLAPSAGLALYRGVQESLTNVLKHAGPGASARVVLVWGERAVEARVDDDGGGAGPMVTTSGDGDGRGLRGMRERLALHGGTVGAGPREGGGFAVRLHLPLVRP